MLKGKYVATVTYEFDIPNDALKEMIDAVSSDSFGDVITENMNDVLGDEFNDEFSNCKVEMVSFEREEVPE